MNTDDHIRLYKERQAIRERMKKMQHNKVLWQEWQKLKEEEKELTERLKSMIE